MKTRVKTREHPIRQTNLKRNQRPQVESLGAGQRQSPRTQEDGPGKGLGSPYEAGTKVEADLECE